MSGPRKSFYIILPLLSCLVALVLVELGLALFYPIPYSLETNMYFMPDPYTGYAHKPFSKGSYPNGIAAVANSQGLRDDEVEIPKPPGVFRILALGDSFTVGANVEQDDAYPQVLERLLNDSGKGRIEVVNAGVGGWSPFQYAQFLDNYGLRYEPDLVLVGLFVGNDIFVDRFAPDQTMTAVLGRRVSKAAADDPWIAPRVFAYQNSHIVRALMRSNPEMLEFSREKCDEFTDTYIIIQKDRVGAHRAAQPADQMVLAEQNVGEIRRISQSAADLGAGLAVFIFPDENQLNAALQAEVIPPGELADYDFDQPQKYLREQFTAAGINWLDLLDVFRSDPRCLYMNDTHWIAAGHELVAQKISEFLADRNLVPRADE